jgi:hypothetical protein
MKEIVSRDFGICWKCGGKLLYLTSVYQLGVPDAGGKNLKQILGEDKDITGVCSVCGNKVQLTTSVYGITTPEYEPLVQDQENINNRKMNLIGYVNEKGD